MSEQSVVNKILDDIEDVLLRDDEDSEALTAILAALRGPDKDTDDKQTTTSPIRSMVFPRLWEKMSRMQYSMTINWTMTDPKTYVEPDGQDHFSCHIRNARYALLRIKR